MGIRFYCSHCGHKLNVKAFQAGRRGLCPYCGGSIHIPTESTRPSSRQLRDRQAYYPPADDQGGAADGLAPPEVKTSAAAPSAGGGEMGPNQPALPLAEPPAAAANPIAPYTPIAGQIPGQPAPGVSPQAGDQAPAPTSGQPAAAFPSPVEPPTEGMIDSAVPATGDLSPTASAVPPTPGQPPTVPPPGGVDPLAEAPGAVWYVRPPDGGQFGPAASDVMQGWIADGRVSPDTMVWREGWRDWQAASHVFAQLRALEAQPGLGAITMTPPVSATVAGSGYRLHSRNRSTGLNGLVITILVLAVIVLVGVFIWVVKGGAQGLGGRSPRAPLSTAPAIDCQTVRSSLLAARLSPLSPPIAESPGVSFSP